MSGDVDTSLGADDARPRYAAAALTHVGGVREHNEDTFYIGTDVCVVADGMGGHAAGEVASNLVTQIVSDVFAAHRLDLAELPRFVSALNAAVQRKGAENHTPGMGTTVVGVATADNGETASAVVFHVGDSRCYRLVDNRLSQITTDHSHVQDLVSAGRITVEEAAVHPLRNVVTRALGADVVVEADFHVLPDEDCRLLLCSDGLSGEIDDDRIWDLLTRHRDPTDAAQALIDAVLEGPARDNVTALVLDLVFPPADGGRATGSMPVVQVTFDGDDETEELDITADAVARAAGRGVDAESDSAGDAEVTADPDDAPAGREWAPPTATDRRTAEVDRPSAPSREAAWGEPVHDEGDT